MVKSQEGDKKAYEELLHEVSMFLNSYLRPKVFNAEFLDDIIQEILMGVHKSRHTYDPKRSFMSWLLAITHYKLTDHIRSINKADSSDPLNEDVKEHQASVDLLMDLIKLEDETRFNMSIGKLDERSKQIVLLLKIEGLKVSEVAKRLNLSESNVKVICHRAIDVLKSSLKDKV